MVTAPITKLSDVTSVTVTASSSRLAVPVSTNKSTIDVVVDTTQVSVRSDILETTVELIAVPVGEVSLDTSDIYEALERRVILLHRDTLMPDGSYLGYVGDPNDIVVPSTPGQDLIYNSAAGTQYLDKSQSPQVLWIKREDSAGGNWTESGVGSGSSNTGGIYGGGASSVYLRSQSVDGGVASSVYLEAQSINGGSASG